MDVRGYNLTRRHSGFHCVHHVSSPFEYGEFTVRRLASAHALDLGLVFVVVIWGFSPVLFKIALSELQPLSFVMIRFLLLSAVSVTVLLAGARRDPSVRPFRIPRADIGWLVISGLTGYGVYQLAYVEGLANTTPFASSLLLATVPLWSAVILALFRIERIGLAQWLGILICMGGIAWFLLAGRSHVSEFSPDRALTLDQVVVGDLLSLLAASLFAIYGVVNKRLAPRYTPAELMCYTLLIGTVALAPVGIPALLHQDWSSVSWRSWLIIPYSVIFPIYLTYSIWNWAIGQRGVGYVTIYNYAVPLIAGIIAWLSFGEALTETQIVSGAVTIGGMLLARWAITRRSGVSGAPRAPSGASPAETQVPEPISE
jgi:drug/metabolite transporter (DMT)-like permease